MSLRLQLVSVGILVLLALAVPVYATQGGASLVISETEADMSNAEDARTRPWQVPDVTREHWIVVGLTLFLVIFIVMLHYEALTGLARLMRWLPAIPRARIAVLIFCMLILHVIEIWIFAVGYALLLADPAFGRIEGPLATNLFDYVYYSVTVYTTLGFGDITPTGLIRFLSGTESLVGFVLITWSASFTYLEMARFWRDK